MESSRVKRTVELGQRFGRLTVIELDQRLAPTVRSARNTTVGERAVRVRCTCGKEWIVKISNLIHNNQTGCRTCSPRRVDHKNVSQQN